MAGFNFKLEKVLNYKETVENEKKTKFAQIKQRLHKEELLLDDYYKQKKSIIEEKNSFNENIKAGELYLYNLYINTINKKIERQKSIILKTKEELNKAKDEMLNAVKEKKIFEKLKENKYEEFISEQEKEEEKIVDNLVSYKTATRIRGM
ncbi:MAG: flagellar export protein FliJ [Tissierellia bacterium]|nr:flagellar export protein FliJ [Tissierellia bacterium]